MATFRYTGHRPNPAALSRLIEREGSRRLDVIGERVEATAKRLVGFDTGRLYRTIRRETGRGYVDVIAGRQGRTPYLGYHLFGTEPHVIRVRNRKALRFVMNGEVVFAKSVRHPGTAANPFLQDALAAAAF